jgi:type II secretory pathway pseudopilin PulG
MKSIRSGESGYVLLAVMLAVTLVLVALSIELPRIAQQIKREREEELVHRGKDYATAVKRFVHKNGGRYPLSVEQLEDTNHIRFLRKKYKDPMTGESDWKMVHAGEAQVNIPAPKSNLSSDNKNLSSDNKNPPPTPPPNSPPANGPTIGGGQIIGVASVSKKQSIKEFNDKDHYDEWYFVYDLRLEQSGGTGITVAAPRGAGGAGTMGTLSTSDLPPTGAPTPTPTPAPRN